MSLAQQSSSQLASPSGHKSSKLVHVRHILLPLLLSLASYLSVVVVVEGDDKPFEPMLAVFERVLLGDDGEISPRQEQLILLTTTICNWELPPGDENLLEFPSQLVDVIEREESWKTGT